MNRRIRLRRERRAGWLWGVLIETEAPTWRGSATVRRHLWLCVVPRMPLHLSWEVAA